MSNKGTHFDEFVKQINQNWFSRLKRTIFNIVFNY